MEGGMGNVRDGWVTAVGGGGGDNEDRGRERRMAIGREDHPQPRWGGQAITSWGRRGTGIGVWVLGECSRERGKMKGEHAAGGKGTDLDRSLKIIVGQIKWKYIPINVWVKGFSVSKERHQRQSLGITVVIWQSGYWVLNTRHLYWYSCHCCMITSTFPLIFVYYSSVLSI